MKVEENFIGGCKQFSFCFHFSPDEFGVVYMRARPCMFSISHKTLFASHPLSKEDRTNKSHSLLSFFSFFFAYFSPSLTNTARLH